jgi:hypothetical protein
MTAAVTVVGLGSMAMDNIMVQIVDAIIVFPLWLICMLYGSVTDFSSSKVISRLLFKSRLPEIC